MEWKKLDKALVGALRALNVGARELNHGFPSSRRVVPKQRTEGCAWKESDRNAGRRGSKEERQQRCGAEEIAPWSGRRIEELKTEVRVDAKTRGERVFLVE